jgi:hypothetical protein
VTGPVELRQIEAPSIGSDTVIVVSEAFLPLLWWRNVPVFREVRQELTQLERFLLEMGLALGTVDSETFEEVVSLPRNVLAGGVSRLVAGGALSLIGGELHVVPEVAARFLEQEAVTRQVKSTADFALLPRSGDLLTVAVDKGGGWLRELELTRLASGTNAPVPRDLWGQRRTRYLADRVREGSVAGHQGDIAAVREPADDPPLLPGTGSSNGGADNPARQGGGVCPAYQCHAEVRRGPSGEYVVSAVLHGESKRRRRRSSSGDEQDGAAEVEVDLTGAAGLVESWLELADALEDPATLRAAWRELGPPPSSLEREPLTRRKSPSEWELLLPGAAAHAIAEQGRALTQPVGLAIKCEEAVVELLCRFAPGDQDAEALFARDVAAAALLGSDAPADELESACHEAGAELPATTRYLAPEAVRERIWQLGYYRLAYALREREDFAHD